MNSKIIEDARNTDMINFLRKRNGFTFTVHPGSYRCDQHTSLVIDDDRLSWYWHSKGVGGYGAIDYLIRIEDMTFKNAMEAIEGNIQIAYVPAKTKKSSSILNIPKKKHIAVRLYKYLCVHRGIADNIVNTLIDEGKIYESDRGNLVFVAYDETNKPRFASLRSMYPDKCFRRDCSGSDKSYGFNMTFSQTPRLYIFESPIDAMSHATLEIISTGDKNAWTQQNRLSLSGTSDKAILKYLEMHPFTKELIFCLDNDDAGRSATTTMIRKYENMGCTAFDEPPRGKDLNEDLLAVKTQKRTEKSTHRRSFEVSK